MTDGSSAAIKVLSVVPYFAVLDAATLAVVARTAIRRVYEPGQVVFLEGEPGTGLYVVESGWLKAIKTSSAGREQVMRFVGPGEVFNEVGVLVGSLNLVTIIALEPAALWIIQRKTILQLMDERPGLARIVAQNLAERTLHLIRLVEDLSLRSVESRLARLLLENATEDEVQRRRWTTQAEMASRLGTVPDVLNRALRNLVEQELIAVERHQIKILNRKGLEAKSTIGG
ncbi:MAG: Crp/Fnr family transcriptional regulator [Chloroflexota bacterium]|nr:Crp/Fnr family transcriptional regulator [Chloroflexota bacterium]